MCTRQGQYAGDKRVRGENMIQVWKTHPSKAESSFQRRKRNYRRGETEVFTGACKVVSTSNRTHHLPAVLHRTRYLCRKRPQAAAERKRPIKITFLVHISHLNTSHNRPHDQRFATVVPLSVFGICICICIAHLRALFLSLSLSLSRPLSRSLRSRSDPSLCVRGGTTDAHTVEVEHTRGSQQYYIVCDILGKAGGEGETVGRSQEVIAEGRTRRRTTPRCACIDRKIVPMMRIHAQTLDSLAERAQQCNSSLGLRRHFLSIGTQQ